MYKTRQNGSTLTTILLILWALAGCVPTPAEITIPDEAAGSYSNGQTDTGNGAYDSDPVGEVDEDDDDDGYSEDEGDCNDGDPTTYPDSPYDVVVDGADQNCDGVDGTDDDEDGYASEAVGGSDCDDGDAATHPGAAEIPYDGIGNDCESEDLTDADGDGYDSDIVGGSDCDDDEDEVHPGVLEDNTNGIDDNCEGTIDGLGFEIVWDNPGVENIMGFTATVADSPDGTWFLDLIYGDFAAVEYHDFETDCSAPYVWSSSPAGECAATHFDATDGGSGNITLILTAPDGFTCWAWGNDPESTGCIVEDATTW